MEWTPRALRYSPERERRRSLLRLPHMQPLTDYAVTLRTTPSVDVPDFDPLDGGIDARVLFLFEKPGPMAAGVGRRNASSGFISRDNDDATAEATGRFMQEAGIPRTATVIWNVVPRWNGTITVKADELREGLARTSELMALLPRLRAVVLVGRKAQRVKDDLAATDLRVFRSAHPSPRVRASWPSVWRGIPGVWAEAYRSACTG